MPVRGPCAGARGSRRTSASALDAQAVQCGVDLGARRALRVELLLLDLQVDLLAEDGDVPWRLDPDADLFAHDREHRDLDVISDHDGLVRLARQYQHCDASLLWPSPGRYPDESVLNDSCASIEALHDIGDGALTGTAGPCASLPAADEPPVAASPA